MTLIKHIDDIRNRIMNIQNKLSQNYCLMSKIVTEYFEFELFTINEILLERNIYAIEAIIHALKHNIGVVYILMVIFVTIQSFQQSTNVKVSVALKDFISLGCSKRVCPFL